MFTTTTISSLFLNSFSSIISSWKSIWQLFFYICVLRKTFFQDEVVKIKKNISCKQASESMSQEWQPHERSCVMHYLPASVLDRETGWQVSQISSWKTTFHCGNLCNAASFSAAEMSKKKKKKKCFCVWMPSAVRTLHWPELIFQERQQ